MNLNDYDFKPIKTTAKSKAIKLKLKALKSKAKLSPEKSGNISGNLLKNGD